MKNWFANLTMLAFASFLLAACGDDSSTTNSTPKISDADYEADTYRDLPSCTESREGETAYVVDQEQGYVCKKGKWSEDDEAVKIRSSSSEGITSVDAHAEEDDPASYVSEKIVPIKSKTITGLAQKGPFKAGAIVDIFELELDGKTFAQTGKSFTGKVSNDSGAFKISNVSLKSQYALLRVTGSFKSEINGEPVHGTLTAVTDLSKRENVNVNILTHLEYDRVLYLLNKGMNFTSAKKQAEREVLAAFGFEENTSSSEDLDVLGRTDADSSLVAISRILLAGETKGTNRDEDDLVDLITEIAADIEEDGELKNHGKITNWKRRNCGGYSLQPKEEKCGCKEYDLVCRKICHYFLSNSFIGHYCTKDAEGDFFCGVSEDTGDICFLCTDREWFVKTEEEADEINQWETGRDGEIRIGAATDHKYIYDAHKGLWRIASYEEQGGSYGKLIDSRDGRSYRTVVIGSQTWMADNLIYSKDLEGVSYYYILDSDGTYSIDSVGLLYTWDAANKACPEGWHLPDNLEWETLYNTLRKINSTNSYAASALATCGTNASGFSVPTGSNFELYFYLTGKTSIGYFWSATEAYVWYLKVHDAILSSTDKYQSLFIRCLQDSP
ncbi:MAG: FISUMP domain-containing protein [Fibrobacter sp.]|nr:FISUMP domain-containing protein [Fibrobacter sp.]